jgi:hypothetical protein
MPSLQDKRTQRTKKTAKQLSKYLWGALCLSPVQPRMRHGFSVHGIVQRSAGLQPDYTILTKTLEMSSGEEENLSGGGLDRDIIMC